MKKLIIVLAMSFIWASTTAMAGSWSETIVKSPHIFGINIGNFSGPSYGYSLSRFVELGLQVEGDWLVDKRYAHNDTTDIHGLAGITFTIPVSDSFYLRPLGVNGGVLYEKTEGDDGDVRAYFNFPVLGLGIAQDNMEFILTPMVTYQNYGHDDYTFNLQIFNAAIRMRF